MRKEIKIDGRAAMGIVSRDVWGREDGGGGVGGREERARATQQRGKEGRWCRNSGSARHKLHGTMAGRRPHPVAALLPALLVGLGESSAG